MQQHGRTRPVPESSSDRGATREGMPAAGWFDAQEAAAEAITGPGVAPRTIAISAEGRDGTARFHLSAGAAAELMFEIGYALERAAVLESGRAARMSLVS